jgi:PAS domain S-box-containing protein
MLVTGTHDPALVALSILVASFASYTALDLGGQLKRAQGVTRRLWLLTAAISMGGGIWAMHFIAMLAFVLPIPMSYDVGLTLLSLLVAIVVTGVGFHVISRQAKSAFSTALSGTLVGLGIVSMHYTGMAAMQSHASVSYDPIYVLLSILVAIGASSAALELSVRRTDFKQKLIAALVMGVAISGMHYTAMAGSFFWAHAPTSETSATTFDQTKLALAVATITFMILIFALVASFFDRRIAVAEEREALLRQTLDTIPIMAWQASPNGIPEYVNKRALDYAGISLQASPESWWRAVVHADDFPGLSKWWTQIIADGKSSEIEVRLRRVDGKYRWFLIRAETLRDGRGRITKWYGANTDIEDRKCAEDALRRSEAYLAEAQRLSLTGSFGWRVDTGDIVWSAETYRVFDLASDLKPNIEIVLARTHPDDRHLVERAIEGALRHRRPIDIVHRLLLPNDLIRHVRVLAHAQSDDSVALEYIGAVTDITAAKAAEQALYNAHAELAHVNRVATMGQLTASIAHEVNQPIAAVLINAETALRWLERQPPNLEAMQRSLTQIIKCGRRAGEVVGRIHDLIKKAPPRRDLIEINTPVREVIELTRGEAVKNGVALNAELAEDLPPIRGDPVQLQQVILNLIMNAVEAMSGVRDGTRELLVSTGKGASGDLLVAVQDSGPGLTPAAHKCIFEAFYTTKTAGLGMGLPICRSIVEAHGGRLWASAKSPRGAVFQFSLPVRQESGAARHQA